MSDNEEKYQELKSYMIGEYGSSFIAAIAKLNAKNPFDKNGLLKPSYVLSQKEKKALLLYAPKAPVFESPKIDDYKVFLKEVDSYTIETISSIDSSKELSNNVAWDIEGVEFGFHDGQYNKYSMQVKDRAFWEAEKTNLKTESNWRYNHDYKNARIKLGCLVHEGIAASKILNLGLYIELLEQKGIPCFIDYERSIFHFNALENEVNLSHINR